MGAVSLSSVSGATCLCYARSYHCTADSLPTPFLPRPPWAAGPRAWGDASPTGRRLAATAGSHC